ncbi:MAG: hypothetical protein GY862_22090 [Gammaproteobacteria bacterium]|nr:hypothetical protein [Gammaproteobacteria bacterium]
MLGDIISDYNVAENISLLPDMLFAEKDRRFMVSLLYYFGRLIKKLYGKA